MEHRENPCHGRSDFTEHQLVVFCTVAQHLSYTRAAEALYLSQPAVAQQVRSIEQALGLRLFARQGRGIVLTRAGHELLRHAERLLRLLAETAPVSDAIRALHRGSVVLGASTSAGTYVVPPLLGAFHARYSEIQITLMVANRHAIEEALLAHQADFAVMSLVAQPDRFVVEFLRPYELVVVAPPSHALAGRPALTPADLQHELFLLGDRDSATRLATEQHFAQAGVPLETTLELGGIEAIKEGVSAGLGIAVIAHEAVAFELDDGDLVLLPVQGFPLQRRLHIVRVKGRRLSQAAAALRQLLLDSRA
ncbi:MAG: LysR family transcriptional regulator [Chloroflexia bacterium]